MTHPRWACAESLLDMTAGGAPLLQMGILAVGYCVLLVALDMLQMHPVLRAKLQFWAPAVEKPQGWEDERVLAEADKLGSPQDVACRVAGVRKVYGSTGLRRFLFPSRVVHAVKGVNFTMKRGEVFGLLGANGAGKSSIFSMLAGALSPTEGSIHVEGEDMGTGDGARLARKRIGYCPQENALLELMTSKEHLVFYAKLKGVPPEILEDITNSKLSQLGLASYTRNYAQNLSGGNKRKLMVAIALVGDAPTVLMDEPSAGMDPEARRFMWNVIQNVATKSAHSSVLLSTHSMEECEALCVRSTIMVNGVLRCLDTNRAIREQYGSGFELMAKVEKPTEAELRSVMAGWSIPAEAQEPGAEAVILRSQLAPWAEHSPFHKLAISGPTSPWPESYEHLPSGIRVVAEWWALTSRFQALHAFVARGCGEAHLTDWHGQMARYKLTTTQALGELFGMLEASKASLGISEYSLSATTLEQVFNRFVREQTTSGQKGQESGPQQVNESASRAGYDMYLTAAVAPAAAAVDVAGLPSATAVPVSVPEPAVAETQPPAAGEQLPASDEELPTEPSATATPALPASSDGFQEEAPREGTKENL